MQDVLITRGAHVGLCEALMLGDDARVEELLRSGVLAAQATSRSTSVSGLGPNAPALIGAAGARPRATLHPPSALPPHEPESSPRIRKD